MRFTKDYVFKHIKTTKYPCWSLYIVQGYKRTPLIHYNGDDFTDNETTDSKTEKSINRLAAVLDDMPADAVLSIDLKTSQKSPAAGYLGPVEFCNVTKDDAAAAIPTQPQSLGGFGGFGTPPPGWVNEETLNSKLEALSVQNEKKINDMLFKQREREFEERVRRERAELEKLKTELNDEKKKYDSTTGQAADTLVFAVKKILAELFPNLPSNTSTPPAALDGADGNVEEVNHVDTTSPKFKEVEKLANMLYEDNNVTAGDVEQIRKYILNKSTQPAATVQPTQQAPSGGEDALL